MSERHIETIARGICRKDGRLLLCMPADRSYAYLPGGHIEFGETGRVALKREMAEETGLEVSVGKLVDVVESSFVQKGEMHCEINLVYEMSIVGEFPETVTSCEDWICFDWVEAAKLDSINLLPAEMKPCCM